MKRFYSLIIICAISGILSGCSKSAKTQLVPNETGNRVETEDLASCPGAGNLSVTHGHVVTTALGTIQYTATAGYLPIYAEGTQTGKVHACLFFFSYTRDDQATNKDWPLTFLFNGGPGSPSDWLHLGGLGPKKLSFGPEGIEPKSADLVDDASTLLINSDLVFIDPINTGYSRVVDGADPTAYNGLHQDANSIGDFIQSYLTRFARAASPKFILGESYGGMRLPILTRYLDEKLGIKLTGLVFVSPWLDAIGDTVFGSSDEADDLPYVNYLPEYATIAWYHKKLAADLEAKDVETVFKEAEAFANTDYMTALAAGNELPEAQKKAVLSQVARYTGLDPVFIQENGLRFSTDQFVGEILKSQNQTIAYYDGRMKGPMIGSDYQDPYNAFDPFFSTATKNYFGGVLGITTDLKYASNNWTSWPGANPDGDIQGAYLSVLDDINKLMTNNPKLKVYMSSGLFDLVCPPAEMQFMIRHLQPAAAARIQVGLYQGGHPLYFGDISHVKFNDAMTAFMHTAIPSPLALPSAR